MRIIHITDCYLPSMGGIETLVSTIVKNQVADGHEVAVLTATPQQQAGGFQLPFDTPASREAWLKQNLGRTGNPVVVRTGWPNTFNAPFDPRARGRWTSWLESPQGGGDFDVVHLHLGEMTPGVTSMMRYLARHKIPTVVSIHSVWSKRTKRWRRIKWALNGITSSLFVWAPVSELVASRVRGAAFAANVYIQPGAVHSDQWRVVPQDHHGLVAVTATRFAPRKRVPELLSMLREVGRRLDLNDDGPDAPTTIPDVRVALIGEGPGLMSARHFVKENHMTRWVALPGRMDADGLRSMYQASDVFLAPGVNDAFSVACVEARSAGLAVLARSQSGFGADLLEQEGSAVENDAEFIDQLVEWAEDTAGGGTAVADIKRHNLETPYRHSWESAMPKLYDLYDRAMAMVQ